MVSDTHRTRDRLCTFQSHVWWSHSSSSWHSFLTCPLRWCGRGLQRVCVTPEERSVLSGADYTETQSERADLTRQALQQEDQGFATCHWWQNARCERGKRKVADKWDSALYEVVAVNPDIHFYKIKDINSGKLRVVHRNVLLRVNFLPIDNGQETHTSDIGEMVPEVNPTEEVDGSDEMVQEANPPDEVGWAKRVRMKSL